MITKEKDIQKLFKTILKQKKKMKKSKLTLMIKEKV